MLCENVTLTRKKLISIIIKMHIHRYLKYCLLAPVFYLLCCSGGKEERKETVSKQPENINQSKGVSSITPQEISDIIDIWTASQNEKDFHTYSNLYSTKFQGIKRTKSGHTTKMNLNEWLADRNKMFKQAVNLNISISNIQQVSMDSSGTTIKFTQNYQSLKYSDVGEKIMKLTKSDNIILIVYEELLFSIQD